MTCGCYVIFGEKVGRIHVFLFRPHKCSGTDCLLGLTLKTDVLIFCSSFYENKRQVVFVLSCGITTRFNTS